MRVRKRRCLDRRAGVPYVLSSPQGHLLAEGRELGCVEAGGLLSRLRGRGALVAFLAGLAGSITALATTTLAAVTVTTAATTLTAVTVTTAATTLTAVAVTTAATTLTAVAVTTAATTLTSSTPASVKADELSCGYNLLFLGFLGLTLRLLLGILVLGFFLGLGCNGENGSIFLALERHRICKLGVGRNTADAALLKLG